MLSCENVPVFILAGGLGTRLSEETTIRPKPMVEIGEIPILVHLMRWYYWHGFNDFVICGGYRCWDIKDYFLHYDFRRNDVLIDHRGDTDVPPVVSRRSNIQERWRVNVLDTGVDSMTGARVARALDFLRDRDFKHFALTYGDGLSDVDLQAELKFHGEHQRVGTVLGVPPPARWGELDVDSDNCARGFLEKPEMRTGLINGGFFFFKREFRDYLSDAAECVLEKEPMDNLAKGGQLMVFKHTGFWHPMDTLRDKTHLQNVWDSGKAPWKSAFPRMVRPNGTGGGGGGGGQTSVASAQTTRSSCVA